MQSTPPNFCASCAAPGEGAQCIFTSTSLARPLVQAKITVGKTLRPNMQQWNAKLNKNSKPIFYQLQTCLTLTPKLPWTNPNPSSILYYTLISILLYANPEHPQPTACGIDSGMYLACFLGMCVVVCFCCIDLISYRKPPTLGCRV